MVSLAGCDEIIPLRQWGITEPPNGRAICDGLSEDKKLGTLSSSFVV